MTRIRISRPGNDPSKAHDSALRGRTRTFKPATQVADARFSSQQLRRSALTRGYGFSFIPSVAVWPRSDEGAAGKLDADLRPAVQEVQQLTQSLPQELHETVPMLEQQASESDVSDMVDRSSNNPAALDAALRSDLEAALHVPLHNVRVHTGLDADRAAHVLGALAFTIDDDVFFRDGVYKPSEPEGQRVIAHEVAHTVQARGTRTVLEDAVAVHPLNGAAEHEADAFANDFVLRLDDPVCGSDHPSIEERHVDQSRKLAGMSAHSHADAAGLARTTSVLRERTGPGISLHPAEKVLKYAAKWLAKRETRTISKHVARHARRIAGRAIHSVFKQPRHIKSMVERAVQEAVELAAKNATKPAREAIEEGAIRIIHQATGTPGKVRWIVQKTFREAIGTQGERILRIIVDQSGRVVSAFPTDRLIALGLGLGAIELLGERSAAAAERARSNAELDAQRENETSWWEFVPFIGDLWGGNLNAGESEELRLHAELTRDIQEVVSTIEREEGRQLAADERRVVEETYRAAIAAPLLYEADGKESE